MLFSLSAAVFASPIVCDNFRGDSFTPKMVILFKFESLAGDGTRAAVLLLILLLFGSPVADFDLELMTWLRAKSYSHLRKSGFLYGDSGFVPNRFLNDSLGVTEHFMVALLLLLDGAKVPFMDVDGGADLADTGLLAFSALDVDEIGSFFTRNLLVAPLTASDDAFLFFKFVRAADTTIESLNALLLLLLIDAVLLLLLLLIALELLMVFFRLNLLLCMLLLLFWLLLTVLDGAPAVALVEYEHREWDKLTGKTPKLAHVFTLMDADVEMGDDERLLK